VPILPAFTILGQICCANLFGFSGLFLAVPLLIVGYIWFKEVIIRDILDSWKLSP
jgi:predicted PurR-regulated permease PerM